MGLPTPDPDSTCLVTGGSSGIGRAIAGELARRGYGVTIVARGTQRLEDTATELRRSHSVRVETVSLDLDDPEARRQLPQTLTERGLDVDVLVNNAGFGTGGRVSESDEVRESGLVRTNVEALVSLCSLFTGAMVRRNRGAVLNVGSAAGFQPIPGEAAYAASKAFVFNYTLALRVELAPAGVGATVLCPGPVKTAPEDDGAGSEDRRDVMPRFMWQSPEAVARAGVDGLARGRAVVIPGWPNRVMAVAADHTPHALLMPLMARLSPSNRT
jgi:short-subunit dehydrogenase